MSIAQRLDLRQTQSLVMTPQLQQAIKLLQLSNVELQAFLQTELEDNPLLTLSEPEDNDLEEEENSHEALSLESAEPNALEGDWEQVWDGPTIETDSPEPQSFSEALTPDRSGMREPDFDPFHNLTASEFTLREHLTDQLNLSCSFKSPERRLLGVLLIDHLDGAGYLREDLAQLAIRLGCEESYLLETVKDLQQLEPAGVFARDLAECLSLQLNDQGQLSLSMKTLLQHLDLLATGNLDKLSRLCQVDRAQINQMVHVIRSLNPKPGAIFDTPRAETLIPDVFVRPTPHQAGSWRVELNSTNLPRVLVDGEYYTTVRSQVSDDQQKGYLQERHSAASSLVKALHQRSTSILRVASEIVRQQEAFLNHGVKYMRPLILRDVAEKLELHESTVSRITTNKYISTPRGVFEMKYFFTAALHALNGAEAHSSEAVKFRIKDLIDKEPPAAPLSDDQLVFFLRQKGIQIARRTVAKYREGLNLPSSFERRRQSLHRAT